MNNVSFELYYFVLLQIRVIPAKYTATSTNFFFKLEVCMPAFFSVSTIQVRKGKLQNDGR